jgi:hypothetical protein
MGVFLLLGFQGNGIKHSTWLYGTRADVKPDDRELHNGSEWGSLENVLILTSIRGCLNAQAHRMEAMGVSSRESCHSIHLRLVLRWWVPRLLLN